MTKPHSTTYTAPAILTPDDAIRDTSMAVRLLARSAWVSHRGAGAMADAIRQLSPRSILAAAGGVPERLLAITVQQAKDVVRALIGSEWVTLEAGTVACNTLDKQLVIPRASPPSNRVPDCACLDRDVDIQALGTAQITDIGQENVYVEKDGAAYFFKPGNTDNFQTGPHDFSQAWVFGGDPASLKSSEQRAAVKP